MYSIRLNYWISQLNLNFEKSDYYTITIHAKIFFVFQKLQYNWKCLNVSHINMFHHNIVNNIICSWEYFLPWFIYKHNWLLKFIMFLESQVHGLDWALILVLLGYTYVYIHISTIIVQIYKLHMKYFSFI